MPRLLAGLVVMGVGTALMVLARLGLGPWDVLHQGISRHTGIAIGTVNIAVGAIVLVAWIPLRQPLGFGTLFNVVLIGLVVDVVLAQTSPPSDMVARAGLLVAGVVLIGAGSGLYIGAGLGPGPRDGLMTSISERTGRSLRVVRTGIELTVLAAGWAMGGTVGVGTLLFAVAIGPLLQLFLGRLVVKTLSIGAE